MTKLIRVAALVMGFLLLAALVAWFYMNREEEFVAHLEMESDAMAVVDYYYPRQVRLSDTPAEPDLKLPAFISSARFGALKLGNGPDSLISVMLAQQAGNDSMFLYVDKNNNQDLRDDTDADWDEVGRTYMSRDVLVDVNYVEEGKEQIVPYPLTFYRYTNKLPDVVIAFRNGYRKGHVTLGDSTYGIAVFDDDLDGAFDQLDRGALVIDSNRDGVLAGASDSEEYLPLSSRFAAGGWTYHVKNVSVSGYRIVFVRDDTTLFAGDTPGTDSRAPAFRTEAIDGEILDLADYRNKVVLLDFWATWCSPWKEHLPDLKRTYNRYHRRGFDIIGLNLDYDVEHLRAYLAKAGVDWPQITDGRGWEMPLVDVYRIRSLPKSFLLDRNGIIRYKDLRGKELESKVFELLNEPEPEE